MQNCISVAKRHEKITQPKKATETYGVYRTNGDGVCFQVATKGEKQIFFLKSPGN